MPSLGNRRSVDQGEVTQYQGLLVYCLSELRADADIRTTLTNETALLSRQMSINQQSPNCGCCNEVTNLPFLSTLQNPGTSTYDIHDMRPNKELVREKIFTAAKFESMYIKSTI